MNTILSLVKKDYLLFWKDKVSVSLTFVVPIVLIFIFGKVFSGSSGPEKIELGFINSSDAPIAKKLETILDTTKTFRLVKTYTDEKGVTIKFDTNTIKQYVITGKFSSALVIPEDAYNDTSLGLKLKFYYDPKNDLEMQVVQGVLQQTIMQSVPEIFNQSMQRQSNNFLGKEKGTMFNSEMANVIGKYFNIDTSRILGNIKNPAVQIQKDTSTKSFNFFDNILNLEKQQLVGKEITNPWATRSVGGWAMMFLLFSITGAASSLFDEKKSGVVLRILSSPVTRTQILWSKYIYNMTLGIIQLYVMFIAGMIFFNINIFPNFFNLFLVILAASTACTGFGMFLSSISKTSAQANGWGTLLILTMSAIGGAWFPVSFMPGYIQFFSKLTLVYWSVDGFLTVLWRGAGFTEILPNLLILFGIAILINIISILNFRKGNVF